MRGYLSQKPEPEVVKRKSKKNLKRDKGKKKKEWEEGR
jgi:hypothetical protein